MSGCRSARDNQIDLLERELRTQEDYIYELEDYVLEYSEKLRQARCIEPHELVTQTESYEPELRPTKRTDKPPVEEPADRLPEPEQPEPEIESDEFESDEPESLLPEELDIPELELETSEPIGQLVEPWEDSLVEAEFSRDYESKQDHESEQNFESDEESVFYQDDTVELVSTTDEPLPDETITNEPSNHEYASEAEFLEKLFEEESPDLDYRQAERLVIIGVYRGDQSEESPTSLLTVIEARDANDEPVDLDGKISLMIMTADSVSPQRLKRWDFNAEETASAWQSSQLGDGLHLELPLEDYVESTEPLELWVRLVGADGRKLLAQLPLQWEQLISVEEAMETRQLLTDDIQLTENDARPLPRQELAGLPATEQEPAQSDRRPVQSDRRIASKADPQWRASLQRSGRLADGYSSTAKAAKGWISQPTSGRGLATARQSSTSVRQAAVAPRDKKPVWTAGRSSSTTPSTSSTQQRPQWSPPASAR